MIVHAIYKKQLRNFLFHMETFCNTHDINVDFRTFLFYKKNDFCSPSYQTLFLCPKPYLTNSKAFIEYYSSIDQDFRKDLFENEDDDIKLIFNSLKKNIKLVKLLKKIMGDDSIL